MSGEIIIKAEGLGKKYIIGHKAERERYTALRDVMVRKIKALGRYAYSSRKAVRRRRDELEEFWALKDLSFEIRRGEVVGIIGRNGAGKSTLLKILSRITEPSRGRVILKGRVGSLLEVGTGFHPELSGRENIYLNGAVLGMKRAEIKRKFDEIVAFAEVEKFLDTPVKRYSSGMYVRLAFAVAAHLDPEILVVDEVLAVGDADFQKKCLGKMSDVAQAGRTVLFVSHNMAAVRTLCPRAILLSRGGPLLDGATDSVIDCYLRGGGVCRISRWSRPACTTHSPAYFTSITVHLEGEQPSLVLLISANVRCAGPRCPKAFVAVDIVDALGAPIMQAMPDVEPSIELLPGDYRLCMHIDLPPLIPGTYAADVWLGSHYTETLDYIRSAVGFEVTTSPSPGRTFPHTADHGYMVPSSRCSWQPCGSVARYDGSSLHAV
jgi:homopolymeric O-antigen transport system ATP-binding protein